MGLIQRADLPEKIRRAFGIREKGVGSTISPEIVPVVLVEDLTGPTIDTGYPRLVFGSVASGASAGVYSESFIINPLGAQTDFVLNELWVKLTSSGILYLRTGVVGSLNNMLGTQDLIWNQDLRTQARPGAYVDSRNEAATVVAERYISLYVVSSAFTVLPTQHTLGPGDWISIYAASYNVGTDLLLWGYERLRTTT